MKKSPPQKQPPVGEDRRFVISIKLVEL